ncbi:MAG: DNA polymerase II large subunit [Nanoarchaeota archaeon]
MNIQQYFKDIENGTKAVYAIAEKAREKGLDPVDKVEIPLAMTMAEKVVALVSTIYPQMEGAGIDKRILELEKEYGKLDVAVVFKIAEEIAKQKFCRFDSLLHAIDAGIRIGFAYNTLGVVSSPIEGFTELKLAKTAKGEDYFVAYFSGPIRSAGTTAASVVLILIDYLREMFGYAKYDPREEEVKRTATELLDYHERITNLQYMPTEEEILFLARNLPFQVNGEASETLEVSNYKNLDRIETNYVRGGMCLILGEGLAQKAKKAFRLLKSLKTRGFKSSGFDFLEEYIKLHEKREVGKADESPTYIKDLVAGRPIFGHPSKSGGFRFRYGRGRTSGFSAFSLHPATMAITDDFIAIGTQLKIEKPTKGGVVTSCDTIDGPIVKLFNGSVKKIKNKAEAKKLYPDVEEIIYLGDILFPFSDVANRNFALIKPGYVEEWWSLEAREKDPELEKQIDKFNIGIEQAIDLSETLRIPLHPRHIFYWTEISIDEFFGLMEWIKYSRVAGKLILPYRKNDQDKFKLGKRALELLGIEHEVTIEDVVLSKENSKALFINLGMDIQVLEKEGQLPSEIIDQTKFDREKSVLEIINSLSKFIIKDKAGDFIGARMGRPEKAKLRKLVGSPNVLFPIGTEGGRLRSVQAACEVGTVRSSFPMKFCERCNKETIYPACEDCGEKTRKMYYCYMCKTKSFFKCKEHPLKSHAYSTISLDIKNYFAKALAKSGLTREKAPPLVKGVRGISSTAKATENLTKGILRAKHNLQVNKDGTIRFDVTELPLICFKPKEISTSVEKLRELGYTQDIDGNELANDEQILELMPHDILLPSAQAPHDEKADEVFVKISNFIDDLLANFYGLDKLYNVKKREDLVGHMGVCMAPHNCAGVICRIIGFANVLGLFASPYMHAAIRRDCDGDEAAIMLLGDVLLNFSREFLPSHRGGTQDAPLVLNAKIDAGEVDEQILDFEFVREYPLALYQMAETRKHSSEVKINDLRTLMREKKNTFEGMGFTHNTSNFNEGVICSNYKILATMQEKVKHQMELVEKIRAVDAADTARLIIERHFLKDLRGNLRGFSMQEFRCVACNEIMRRPPLTGKCQACGGKIIFTIHEGGIRKYLEPALDLANKYNLSVYLKQSLELTKRHIESIFGKDADKQEALGKWL